MLQIVFRFLEEILWCNPMIQNIDLLIQKQANMMLLGLIEVFNILHNYAICSQKIHLTWYSTVIKTFAKQNRHKIAKKNLFCVFNFSFFNRQSTFHGCYCGLWKCRVIIATCVPTTATVGPPFVWMVWEWEDTNIRWHRKKREFEIIWYLVTHPIRHIFHLFSGDSL